MSSTHPRVRFVRSASFSAAHRYYNSGLSPIENQKLYGSLYREHGFGHNFVVEMHLEGEINPLTGMIVNLRDVDAWLKAILGPLDHQDLNALEPFKQAAPTPEKIALFIYRAAENHLSRHLIEVEAEEGTRPSIRLCKVRLYEGENFWVDVEGKP